MNSVENEHSNSENIYEIVEAEVQNSKNSISEVYDVADQGESEAYVVKTYPQTNSLTFFVDNYSKELTIVGIGMVWIVALIVICRLIKDGDWKWGLD